VDHGKTALVRVLTGVDCDRLPEERERGLTIVLGYAPLELPSGRRLSVVDVPGHERFVRTMVAGATGVDAGLLAIAADDGVMPQTVEHAAVLRALGVRAGVVAVTKADLADPAPAAGAAAELVPGWPVVACSAHTGEGLDALRAALDALAAGLPSRAERGGPCVLHVDRVFSVTGRGTVVTGTLWSGAISAGDRLALLPGARPVRVRGVHVHDRAEERALAGQRVAVNLAGVDPREVARGDVLGAPGAVVESRILDCALELREARHGMRVQVLHGTRHVAGRLVELGGSAWQLRLERPLLAANGDRVVIRRLAPADTLGGGVVLDAAAGRHGRSRPDAGRHASARPDAGRHTSGFRGIKRPASAIEQAAAAAPGTSTRSPAALAREAALRAAGPALLPEDAELRALRAAGRAVRVAGRLYAHPDVVAEVRAIALAHIDEHGSIALADLRDALGVSRKPAQAFLEHFDAERVTRRLPDDRRVRSRRTPARA
jgi:selenocysteine-specific elongation factor